MSYIKTNLDGIISIKPRERGGTIAANRLEYQRNWTLCYLLRTHDERKDYTILLDYHDDMVVIDDAESLRAIDFYQLKTDRTANWTLSTLLKRSKKEGGELHGNSICGKMYFNRIQFPEMTRSLNFISNTQFKVAIAGADEKERVVDEFDIGTLTVTAQNSYRNAIREEFNLPDAPLLDIRILFRRDSLNWDGHDKQTVGELVDYLEKRCPGGKFAAKAAFSALQSIIAKKSSCERNIETAEELVRTRGITKVEFEGMIQLIMNSESQSSKSADTELFSLLSREHAFSAGEIKQLQSEWRKYAVARLDVANPTIFDFRTIVSGTVTIFRSARPNCSMRDLVEECYVDVAGKLSGASPFSDKYIKAAILLEFNES